MTPPLTCALTLSTQRPLVSEPLPVEVKGLAECNCDAVLWCIEYMHLVWTEVHRIYAPGLD